MKSAARRRGFSLLEVMISAAVLGVGVLAGVRLFTTGVEGNAWTRSRSTATTMAIQRLEQLGTRGVDLLPAGCTGPVGCKAGQQELAPPVPCTQQVDEMNVDVSVSEPNGKYRVDTVVEPHPDGGRQLGARVVTVSVCWQDPDGSVHEAQLDRLFVPNI